MKTFLYSALAVISAFTGIAASKSSSSSYRVSKIYKYIGTYPVSTAHQVTLTTNWTLVAGRPAFCSSNVQACAVSTTIPQFTLANGRVIPSTPIPAFQTIFGASPRFTAAANTSGVKTVFSDPNSN